MAKYTGPDCRLCRREGCKLFLKGDKCYSEKCTFIKRQTPPGIHGASRKKPTPYSIQLREKQKVKRIYNLTESSSINTTNSQKKCVELPVKTCSFFWKEDSTTSFTEWA